AVCEIRYGHRLSAQSDGIFGQRRYAHPGSHIVYVQRRLRTLSYALEEIGEDEPVYAFMPFPNAFLEILLPQRMLVLLPKALRIAELISPGMFIGRMLPI